MAFNRAPLALAAFALALLLAASCAQAKICSSPSKTYHPVPTKCDPHTCATKCHKEHYNSGALFTGGYCQVIGLNGETVLDEGGGGDDLPEWHKKKKKRCECTKECSAGGGGTPPPPSDVPEPPPSGGDEPVPPPSGGKKSPPSAGARKMSPGEERNV
ncbi:major pollen allergen Art v 1-like [Brachypodium distachyon]|uniref:Uncharacterized protein n=1 Tax=Brachypodium distachyon TaxID=15368 RepID=A0A2K2DGW7_BRADI|nr:major pollen allergen Art v 1-like [Brachypodium distachyon]PNT73525.1 hypothetical protein BRADI_2g59772v3 [Brachypodium distachyon]|eukprot:XP_024315881.1 major pollen allergen Art v 1-like [Brachypodium distachyon]